jgi:alpha-mannosidase
MKLEVLGPEGIARMDRAARAILDRTGVKVPHAEMLDRFERAGARVDREALVTNEKPFALSFFPSGAGARPMPGPVLSDEVIQCSAVKQAEDGEALVMRLYEPTGRPRATVISLPFISLKARFRLKGFEVKTLKLGPKGRRFIEVGLLEGAALL